MKIVASYPAIVGAILVDLRRQRGVTQKRVAKKMRMAASTWSRIENGTSALTVDQLWLAADVLESRVNWIAQRADELSDAFRRRHVIVCTAATAATMVETGKYAMCPAETLAQIVEQTR